MALLLRRRVDVVHPVHFLGFLDHRDVEVDHHRLLAAAAEHAGKRLAVARVDLLVRHVRWHVDEVARAGLGDELELVAPAHARLALHYIDDALYRAMVVRTGLGLRVDHHRAGPELLRAGARVGDRGGAVHPRRLRRVDVELGRFDDPHAVELPLRCFVVMSHSDAYFAVLTCY